MSLLYRNLKILKMFPRYISRMKASAVKQVLLVTLSSILYPAVSEARSWYLEPSVTIAGGYDDNPDLRATEPDESLPDTMLLGGNSQSYLEFGTSFLLDSESPSDSISAALATESRRFDESVYDSDLIDTSLEYAKKFEKGELTLGAAYIEEATNNANLAATDLGLIGTDLDRESLSLSIANFRQINTTLTNTVGLTYEEVGFDDNGATASEMAPIEYDETALDLSFTKTVSQRLSVIAGLEYRVYRPAEALEIEAISEEKATTVSLGVDYNLRENLQLRASYAPTSVKTSRVGDAGSSSEDRSLYELGIEYTGFQHSFSAAISRDLTASSLGGLRETDDFTVSWSRINTLGGTISSSLTYGEQDESSASEMSGGTQSFLDFDSQYSKSIRRNLSWTLNYRYREQESLSGQDVDSNSVTIGLRYIWNRKLLALGNN